MSKDSDAGGNGEGAEEVDEWGRGFGGIVMRSVQDIIAKARVAESMANVPTAGLTDQLDDLVKLGEEEDGVCVCVLDIFRIIPCFTVSTQYPSRIQARRTRSRDGLSRHR